MSRLLAKFVRLSLREWPLVAEIVLALAIARLKVAWMDFRRIATQLGAAGADFEEPTPLPTDDRARRIGGLIRGAARHLPWDCKCLAQAIVAKSLLSRRGIACDVYIGVAPGRDGKPFLAHAWTRSGSVYVTGGRESQKFTQLACFRDAS